MIFYLINEKQRIFPNIRKYIYKNSTDHRQNQKGNFKIFYMKITLKIRYENAIRYCLVQK